MLVFNASTAFIIAKLELLKKDHQIKYPSAQQTEQMYHIAN
jgi:hypothetical protein